MEAMRQSWTDDRLDDLSHRMDERFDQVEGQIADTRMEMRTTANSLQSEVKELRGEIKTSADELGGEIKARTDELRGEIKEQGRELRGEIAGVEARLRTQSNEHRAESWEQFDRVHGDMRQMNAAILGLHQTITRIGWSATITLIAAIASVLITRL